MRTNRLFPALVIAISMACFSLPGAAEDSGPPAPAKDQAAHGVLRLLPPDSATEHALSVGGETISYTATAGTLNLYNQNGDRTAAVFYTGYVRSGADTHRRPITFVFNGGPGAASAYLHLGLVGPKVAVFGADGRDGANARLQDNPDSWIPFTDLVLIDPIGTGWSRTAKPDEAKNFYNVQSDAQVLAKVIALYVAQNARTQSPKYILGESYGGFRALKVGRALQQEQGLALSGIVALSPLLDGALTFSSARFALGAALQLPALAAAELERRKAFDWGALAEAERFAMTDYLVTLAARPPEGEAARRFYARVAEITGLPLDIVTQKRGFVRDAYLKHLKADQVASRYDATILASDPFPESTEARNPDPVLDGFSRVLGGLFVGYARDELRFETPMTYPLLSSEVRWDWHRQEASATTELRELLSLNPNFRFLVAHGVSDMVTPYGMSRYVLDHLPPIGKPDRVTLKLYRGGHMFYFDANSRADFAKDMKTFFFIPTQ